jgi:hypothetical protein
MLPPGAAQVLRRAELYNKLGGVHKPLEPGGTGGGQGPPPVPLGHAGGVPLPGISVPQNGAPLDGYGTN